MDKYTLPLTVLNTYNIDYLKSVEQGYLSLNEKAYKIVLSKIEYLINDLLTTTKIPDFEDRVLLDYLYKRNNTTDLQIKAQQNALLSFCNWYESYITELEQLEHINQDLGFLKSNNYKITALNIYLFGISEYE